MAKRIETDSIGKIEVDSNKYWGAQTQRSLENFNIGRGYHNFIPLEIIHAYALLKKAAALTNAELGLLPKEKSDIIGQVCDEILQNKLNDHFPLVIWQTGSGTQTHMNVNEVISNRAIELIGEEMGSKKPIHPNDDVNKSQSSNDTFPTAMNIAAYLLIQNKLLPSLQFFVQKIKDKIEEFKDLIKVGRTHLMDAAPLTLGQEFSGYLSQVEHGIRAIQNTLPHLAELALGGTAVGTGLNAHPEFAKKVALKIAQLTQLPFISAPNKFEAIGTEDVSVEVSGALKRLAGSFMKIANDIRWLASGPRCGLAEISLPANEPGSSIMPGKVNPTQCESLMMVCSQVMGNDLTIALANTHANFEVNSNRPVIAYNLLHSITLLAEGVHNFTEKCLIGIQANPQKINEYLSRSLMLATILNTSIGYEKASLIVKCAHKENLSLKESALKLKLLSEEEFDRWVDPKKMV